ncbi:tetratricopeptide repeat protein [Leptospira langatensis]|uniref:Tetratricopeptide repeat protein n=1 Tax=Leptospira langatensis TaxID=2484983 RepID=A0A5F1ZRL9_9LEPT|nr:tetratricopeptide repeat protein [Leptospira langatensis]TGK05547.1 tetratricopeptide repeat protein [Leptospira langatensis]TGL38680.1 tetratricopeptide repeat protein [Leptospira langatensis]
MKRSLTFVFLLTFFSFGNIDADFPLPFPERADLSEGTQASNAEAISPTASLNSPIETSNQENSSGTAAASRKSSSSAVISGNASDQTTNSGSGPDTSSSTEMATAGPERTSPSSERKIGEEKKSVAKEKKTRLPNLSEKKEKKNGKKKDAQDPSQAAFDRGLLRLRNGQKDAAKEEFSKAATTEGSASAQAKLELAKLEDQKAPEAEAAGAEDDSRWKTSLETARSLRAQGKNSEAESILLRVATEGSGEFRSRALLQLGDMLFRSGRYSDARGYLMDFWNRFGKTFPNAEDQNSREFKRQREEKELGAYLLFKTSYKAGEGEWAKKFLRKYLEKTVSESEGVYSPLRSEMETLAKSNL